MLKWLPALCAAALFSFVLAGLAPAADRPPNILVILIDDMGWKDVGCNGSRFYETPNIDKLAQRGMRFTNAYASCPVCSPTRASLLTGKYPARLHLTDWLPGRRVTNDQKILRPDILDHLPADEFNLAKAMKSAGYRTGIIGKWHLGGGDFLPQKQGFDVNVGGTAGGSPPGGYFNFKTPTMSAASADEYLTDRITDEAEKFIDENKQGPFFLYLSHYAVHIPLQAKQALLEHYREKARKDDPQDNPIYAAMVQSVDESVGRIIRKLDELHLTDNTLIVFTSDNGGLSVKEGPNTPSTSNAPLRGGKGYLYEGGVREPLIVVYPGIRPGSTSDVPVITADFYPTICNLVGVKPQPGQVTDGLDLMPLLKQTGKLDRDALYWHYPHYANQGGKPGGSIRQGNWKLIQFYEDMHVELYNLADDVSEAHDLSAKMPEKAAELTKKLETWRASVNAQMPTPNPNFGAPSGAPGKHKGKAAEREKQGSLNAASISQWDVD